MLKFIALVSDVAAERSERVPDSFVRLTFL